MKKTYKIYGLKTLDKNGSLVFCRNCEKIVVSINKQGYRYIFLSLICTCGVHGSLEIKRDDSTVDLYERSGNMPLDINGVSVCSECGTKLFGVIENRVENYSFCVQCSCGKNYDTRATSSRRLGETAKILIAKNKGIE